MTYQDIIFYIYVLVYFSATEFLNEFEAMLETEEGFDAVFVMPSKFFYFHLKSLINYILFMNFAT